ncbi:tetratricopeptide repeat protein SKI3 isoform X2 [Coffea eugenioides]|uniref:tetratricopeptide repeat protein SKI3 isoform X2 n=1 Tax=Coffea eugenioides TaxID=49369 RepID=UPI000F606367|nr:tetratricopeptide repeat protein SKI3 isoform X2 [Coffea eugenioides]
MIPFPGKLSVICWTNKVHQKRWSEAVQKLQHAIRGYPTCADLWEALGLAYQRLGMFTAAIKSYGRAIELEESRIFALIESGNISLMLGSFRKGVEHFRQALLISPENLAAHYGLASSLLGLAKECINSGAFRWGASLLEEASEVIVSIMTLAGNISCIWKLHGDIKLFYAKCFPWVDDGWGLKADQKSFSDSIISWKRICHLAAVSSSRSYQRALHLAPWQSNLYTDIAIASDITFFSKENHEEDLNSWSQAEKMCLGGLLLEGENNEFWVTLGCLSDHNALRQHAFIRGLQLDVSLAVAWAYLGKLYRLEGERKLAQQAFDRARSIDPSLALPWAGMSADADIRNLKPDEAYDCCLQAVQILPLAEFQIGLAKLGLYSGQMPSSEVFRAIRQALQRAPHYPESHNLNGLICEARSLYQSASASFRLARHAVSSFSGEVSKLYHKDISMNLVRSLCKAGSPNEAVEECELLKKEGLLDLEGLQIYALCLWQLGKNDLALLTARTLAANILSMDSRKAAATISFISRLMYYISGQDSVISSILKMPKDLFQSSKVSFIVSAIDALDCSDQLGPIVSHSHTSLMSSEEITSMHSLIALGKLVKYVSDDRLGIQNGVDHLRKALHMYPHSGLIRNLLSYLLLFSKEWKDVHLATRCFIVDSYDHQKEKVLKSSFEILGAGAVACYTKGRCNDEFSFSTSKEQCLFGTGIIQQLQKDLHREPWNDRARYLLILTYVQKARKEGYPQHLCTIIERLICVALSDEFCSRQESSYEYQRFQLLLCAAEVCLQFGNHIGCVRHAKSASELLLPDDSLFYAHILLCRAYAAQDNFVDMRKEYTRCLELKTDYPIGWVCLKIIDCQYKLQTDGTFLAVGFEECSRDVKKSWNMWMAVGDLVHGLVAIQTKDLLAAEKFLAQACSLAGDESCLFLCHGTICMQLAKQQCDARFLSLAVRSLQKARETSVMLPIVSLLLAQAEASLGSKMKWEKNLRDEWFSWPPGMRPAELYFQMHLLAKQERESSRTSSLIESSQSALRWVLQAIHLNPSCLRYWKVLQTFTG